MPAKAKKSAKETVLETIEKMSVIELSELVKALEEKFGVSAQIPTVQPVAQTQAGAPPPQAEEKKEFDVILAAVGEKKIQVIKEVRAITNLGLKEAKDFVEAAPKTVKSSIPKEEADKIRERLQGVGATIEIK